jgi:hypothetical protein
MVAAAQQPVFRGTPDAVHVLVTVTVTAPAGW